MAMVMVKHIFFYALIASTGQTETQAPQSMHLSESITLFDPSSFIASTGQLESQAPQLIQSSLILCAIKKPPKFIL